MALCVREDYSGAQSLEISAAIGQGPIYEGGEVAIWATDILFFKLHNFSFGFTRMWVEVPTCVSMTAKDLSVVLKGLVSLKIVVFW